MKQNRMMGRRGRSRRLLMLLALSAAAIGLIGCNPQIKQEPASTESQPADLPTASSASEDTVSLADLLARLRTTEGEFTLSTSATWVLPGDHLLFGPFYDFGDDAVEALIECLDDLTPSRVRLLGEPVVVGVLCGLALQGTASPKQYEDGAGDWPGIVQPNATAEDLRTAKDAWLVVFEEGAYGIV